MMVVTAFALIAALVTLSPGLDTRLVLGAGMRRSRGTALRTVAGVVCGLLVWGTIAVVAAALDAVSAMAAVAFHIGVAGYLAVVGVYSTRDGSWAERLLARERRPFRTGLTGNLINPRVGLFYLGLLPLFTGVSGSIVLDQVTFAGIHTVESLLWLTLVAVNSTRYGWLLTFPQTGRGAQFVLGACLVNVAAEAVGTVIDTGGDAADSLAGLQDALKLEEVVAGDQAPSPPTAGRHAGR